MTRKHFKAMALIFGLIHDKRDRGLVVYEFSKVAKSLNPLFDFRRFQDAVEAEHERIEAFNKHLP